MKPFEGSKGGPQFTVWVCFKNFSKFSPKLMEGKHHCFPPPFPLTPGPIPLPNNNRKRGGGDTENEEGEGKIKRRWSIPYY